MTNLTTRVSRLVSGSVNAAIDAIENMSPDMVMEQSIREVEGAIAEVRAELGKASADRHLASKSLANNSAKHDDLAEQITVAVQNERDDLASVAIARQMDLEAQIPVLEQSIAEAAEREKEYENYIDALKGKRADMLDELAAFKARQSEQPENTVIDASGNPSSAHAVNQKIDQASAAFDRASGYAADVLGTSSKDAAQLAELKDLARTSEIEKRLAAVKQKSA